MQVGRYHLKEAQIAEVSPITPPVVPINILANETTPVDSAPGLRSARGVAPEYASKNPLDVTKLVIGPVYAIRRKHLAARAGFMKFCPSPPKSCLTTIIANTHPTISKPTFNVDGIFNAIRRPVTAALKSVTVTSYA